MKQKRVFLIVLDSFGIGAMEDAASYGDIDVNTLRSVYRSAYFHMPNMQKMGLFNIDGVVVGEKEEEYTAAIARMAEASRGKDTTIGHWEIAGVISKQPLPTFPEGFPEELLEAYRQETGRGWEVQQNDFTEKRSCSRPCAESGRQSRYPH